MYLFELVFSVSLGMCSGIIGSYGIFILHFLRNLHPHPFCSTNSKPTTRQAWSTLPLSWGVKDNPPMDNNKNRDSSRVWVFCVLIFLFLRFIFCLQTPSSLSVTSAVENRVVLIKPVSFENNSTIWSSDDDWKIKSSAVAQLSLFHHF